MFQIVIAGTVIGTAVFFDLSGKKEFPTERLCLDDARKTIPDVLDAVRAITEREDRLVFSIRCEPRGEKT